jgi:hypothetical protein
MKVGKFFSLRSRTETPVRRGTSLPSLSLHFLHFLVSGYETDQRIRNCLDTRAFYIIPRVNPDGAELALADRPRFIRSGTRPYFYAEGDWSRLVPEDVDGDGRILNMRLRDPNGRWKTSESDPRVMVLREPTETGGTYYRLLPEGSVIGAEEGEIPAVYPVEGIDFNRNWPSNWAGEAAQRGAGRFPLSEPETHALATFISDHPNIFTWIAGHTFSGVLLRPGFSKPDQQLPPIDLSHYKLVGKRGEELTGYRASDAFTGFRINEGQEIHGSVEWGYENFGIYTWIVEYWAPHRNSGIEIQNFAQWFFEHPGEDDVRMVAWGERELGPGTFVDWYTYEHPHLGTVELGGWDLIRTLYNPPEKKVEETVKPFPEWFLWQAEMSPKLSIKQVLKAEIGKDLWRIEAIVQNVGYLPTYCSAKSLRTRAVRGVEASIESLDQVEYLDRQQRFGLGELAGRAFKTSSALTGFIADETDDCKKVAWTVRAAAGTKLIVVARHDRAGRAHKEIAL